jgi:DNA-binding MarR family transcriptional regulator
MGRFVNLVNDMSQRAADQPVAVASELRPVLFKLGRELRREIHSLGVTGSQVSLLVAIRNTPGIGVRELAVRERMSAAAVSKSVARLEREGFVRRAGVVDRRRIGLELTEDGQRVLRSVRSRRTAWLAARLRRLDADELAAIEAAIAPLSRLLEDER